MVFLFIKNCASRKTNLNQDGWIILEVGIGNILVVEEIFKNHDYKNGKLFRDYNKDQRKIVLKSDFKKIISHIKLFRPLNIFTAALAMTLSGGIVDNYMI